MINALRAGSFNRGLQTALGGEMTKWLFRASSNIKIGLDDCGSKLGMRTFINEENYRSIIGLNLIDNKTSNIVNIKNNDEAKGYIDKHVVVRSPMFCSNPEISYCKVCLGNKIANNKNGISLAISELGSMIMLMKMKAMHGKSLTLARLNKDRMFS
jgi:hypothetical protein